MEGPLWGRFVLSESGVRWAVFGNGASSDCGLRGITVCRVAGQVVGGSAEVYMEDDGGLGGLSIQTTENDGRRAFGL